MCIKIIWGRYRKKKEKKEKLSSILRSGSSGVGMLIQRRASARVLLLIRAFARVGEIKSGKQSEPRVKGVTAHVENPVHSAGTPGRLREAPMSSSWPGTQQAQHLMMLTMKLAKTKSVNSGSATSSVQNYCYCCRKTSHLSLQGRDNIQLPMQPQMSHIRMMTRISCTGFTLATFSSANAPEPMRFREKHVQK